MKAGNMQTASEAFDDRDRTICPWCLKYMADDEDAERDPDSIGDELLCWKNLNECAPCVRDDPLAEINKLRNHICELCRLFTKLCRISAEIVDLNCLPHKDSKKR